MKNAVLRVDVKLRFVFQRDGFCRPFGYLFCMFFHDLIGEESALDYSVFVNSRNSSAVPETSGSTLASPLGMGESVR